MFVVSSPSGGGKTSIVRALLGSEPNLRFSVSFTTRPKREGEIEGQDYFFVTKDTFNKMAKDNQFLEYADVFGNFYGTPKIQTEEMLNNGFDIIYDIDWQGGKKLMEARRQDVVSVFVLPPSIEVLKSRLLSRGTDSGDKLKIRLDQACNDILKCELYDYLVVNDSLEQAIAEVRSILHAEALKKERINTKALLDKLLCS